MLKCSVVLLGHVDVGCKKLSKVSCPVCSQKPWCSKRNRFANSFSLPKFQGSIDGVDGVGSLRFPKVVGETSNEVASM